MLGDVIQKLRREKNLSQSDLAEKLNVSNKIVSNWETGKSLPDVMMMEDIANALDISIEELYNDVKENKTNHVGIDKKPAFTLTVCTCISVLLIIVAILLFVFAFSNWVEVITTKIFVGLSIVLVIITLFLQVIASFYVKLLRTNKYNKAYVNKSMVICDLIFASLFLAFLILVAVYTFGEF